MNEESRNLLIAIALSLAILIGWQMFFLPKAERAVTQQPPATSAQRTDATPAAPDRDAATPAAPVAGKAAPAAVPGASATQPRDAVLAKSPRVKIETPSLSGSINLIGGRLDDLKLVKYRVSVDPGSPVITLLSPEGARNAYYAEPGWVAPAGSTVKVPGPDTRWTAPDGAVLKPGQPVTLSWDNGQGLIFKRTYAVDANYMFTVTQRVENRGGQPVTLFPFARVQRHGIPKLQGFFILHEGLIGVLGGELQEIDYADLKEDGARPLVHDSTGGWLGITDKYWAVTVMPRDGKETIQARFFHLKAGAGDAFQADYLRKGGLTIAAGGDARHESLIFAGAKEVNLIDAYEKQYGIERFELLIDWGWFYFITKPMFWLLHYLYQLLGNYGLAILAATVLIKLVLFPLANRSYASMAEMRKLQPELQRIQQLHKDDRMKMQQAMMELYRKHKVSPMAGCWPVLVQIPVFFALYKVLFVTIDMRHAPFVGWIRDLSAPDPTSIFNLFGLLPFEVPQFLMIGVLPIIMGITMWVQMRLNPPPPDPTQAMIFNWMPVFFTFLLGTFPAGLVLYWAWNNLLSIIQQYYIMKKHGAEVNLWQNIRSALSFGRTRT